MNFCTCRELLTAATSGAQAADSFSVFANKQAEMRPLPFLTSAQCVAMSVSQAAIMSACAGKRPSVNSATAAVARTADPNSLVLILMRTISSSTEKRLAEMQFYPALGRIKGFARRVSGVDLYRPSTALRITSELASFGLPSAEILVLRA